MKASIIAVVVATLLLAGAGLAYVSGAVGVLGLAAIGRADFLAMAPHVIFAQLDSFALMAVPLFILTGELMSRGKITDALVDFAMLIVGGLRGGLGHVTVATAVLFSGISGSAMADASALSSTLVPAMKERGYSATYAGALTAASSILGPIIPPSIIMIFYGAIMGVDVTALFAGGIGPGLLLAGALFAANAYFARHIVSVPPAASEKRSATAIILRALPALMLPLVIMRGMVVGWMTPTEAAAVAVVSAALIAASFRALTWRIVVECLERTVAMTGAIFIALAAAALITFVAALGQAPTQIAEAASHLGVGAKEYLLILMVLFLIAGAVFESIIVLTLIVPVLAPAAIATGVDPLHLGVMICMNLSIGLLVPPLGGSLLVVSAVANIPYWRLAWAVMPFLVIEVAVLAIVTLVPEVTLTLPQMWGLIK